MTRNVSAPGNIKLKAGGVESRTDKSLGSSSLNSSRKRIDEIDDFKEMLNLFEIFNISHDKDELSLTKMKKTLKEVIEEQRSKNGKYSNETTVYSVMSKAKQMDLQRRDKLAFFYSKVNDCLEDMDEKVLSIVNSYIPDILKVLFELVERLKERHYHVLVTGETSAGKSSLINLILGEEVLPSHTLSTTSTICELKYGEERKLVGYRTDESIDTKFLKDPEEGGESYEIQISPFVAETEREQGSKFRKVEIFWPNELLKEGIVIIDSPGVGESDEMDEVMMNYLPNAFAFIYVFDASRAGGMQKDYKNKLMTMMEKLRSFEGGDGQSARLADCSIFVCNKWDLVPEKERDKVKSHFIKKVKECWPDATQHNQIVYLSTKKAVEVQDYGAVTKEFDDLLERIMSMIVRAIDMRLYHHWLWLDFMLYNIYKCTNSFNNMTKLNHEEAQKSISFLESRIVEISVKHQNVQQEIQSEFKSQTEYLLTKLLEYIKTQEFQRKFFTWSWDDNPLYLVCETWEITKNNVMKAVESKFEEILAQWEDEKRVYSEIHRILVQEFLKRLNLIEEELEDVEKAMRGVEIEARYNSISNKRPLGNVGKVLLGVMVPLWVPVGVAGVILVAPVYGAIKVTKTVSGKMNLEKYQKDPITYLTKQSEKFLAHKAEDALRENVTKQMWKTEKVLSRYVELIPRVIEANRKMVSELKSEDRDQTELLQLYGPLETKSYDLQLKMIPLGIELCPSTVDSRDFHWKEDMVSCVGEGEFAVVYRGRTCSTTVESTGGQNVMVKVFKRPFDASNANFYLDEETKIRQMNHKNIVKLYGAMKRSASDGPDEYKFTFVMQSCKANLRSVIFKDNRITPGKADKPKQAIGRFLKWGVEIADGLNYIHEQRLVHRHLKLENVLVNEGDRAMISDVGIVGQYVESEKSIIYLAPEVHRNQVNRTKEGDIYSFGIMLWEMWYGDQAFTELMPVETATFQEKIAEGHRPIIDDKKINVQRVSSIMQRCWKTDADKRMPAKECHENLSKILENQE